jgi:hypothetical protein
MPGRTPSELVSRCLRNAGGDEGERIGAGGGGGGGGGDEESGIEVSGILKSSRGEEGFSMNVARMNVGPTNGG